MTGIKHVVGAQCSLLPSVLLCPGPSADLFSKRLLNRGLRGLHLSKDQAPGEGREAKPRD